MNGDITPSLFITADCFKWCSEQDCKFILSFTQMMSQLLKIFIIHWFLNPFISINTYGQHLNLKGLFVNMKRSNLKLALDLRKQTGGNYLCRSATFPFPVKNKVETCCKKCEKIFWKNGGGFCLPTGCGIYYHLMLILMYIWQNLKPNPYLQD